MADIQRIPMEFDPATGERNPKITDAAEWRLKNNRTPWLYNPWTGELREAWKIGQDSQGLFVMPDAVTSALKVKVSVDGYGIQTVKEWLSKLLLRAWGNDSGENSASETLNVCKRPIFASLIEAGLLCGKVDGTGNIEALDEVEANKFLENVISKMMDIKPY